MATELKLQGDKIKLGSRKSSSSSSLLVQRKRPVSAVPHLRIYGDGTASKETSLREKRPHSADCAPRTAAATRPPSNLHSIEELDKDLLPSTEIFKSLVAEPIASWRGGGKMKPGIVEKPPIAAAASKKNEIIVTSYDTNGLHASNLGAGDSYVKNPSSTSLNDECASDLEEIAAVLAEIQNCSEIVSKTNKPPDLILESLDKSLSEFTFNAKEANNKNDEDLLSEFEQDKLQDEMFMDNNKEEIQYQNWIVENAERRTDEIFEQLKGKNEGDEQVKGKQITFERFFDSKEEKQLNLNLNFDAAKTSKMAKAATAKQKQNVKFAHKPKFVARSMKCNKDYDGGSNKEEDVSWMSRGSVKTKKKAKVAEEGKSDGDDITDILEILDAESKKSKSKIQSIKKIVSTELNAAINSIRGEEQTENSSSSSTCSLDVVPICLNDQKTGATKEEETIKQPCSNFKEILSFLDEVERSSSQSLVNAKERVLVATQLIEGTSMRLDTIPKHEDLATQTQQDLTDQIVELHLRLKEKSSAVRLLQDELSVIREQVVKMTKQTERTVREKLKAQKEEAEATVKRHQKFIDQLIAEKTSLGKQCEGLVRDMKGMEERFEANAKAAEHRHKIELQKAKEMCAVSEKMKRERWLETKTAKIKEMTVKSIEPELQSMTVRHEQELSDLRSIQKREIEEMELRNARNTQKQLESLRIQLGEEREKSLAHERDVMRIRYESIVQSEEKSYQDQRKRLLQEHACRMAECEEREKHCVEEKEKIIKQVRDEYEDKLQDALRKQNNELKLIKEEKLMEMEAWKNDYKKQQDALMIAKEARIRDECRKERDKEIELVIDRLEAETNEARSQLENATENRIKRYKETFEKEVYDTELQLQATKSKYSQAKTKLLQLEETEITLQATVRHLEAELRESLDACKKLQEERAGAKEAAVEEARLGMQKLHSEIARMRDERDTELQQVYSRVKMAVARKDEALTELGRDNLALKEKCGYLESMMEQQRKEYLIK